MQNKKEKMTYMNIIIILLLLPRIVVYCLIRKRKLNFSKKLVKSYFCSFFYESSSIKPKKYDLMFNFEKNYLDEKQKTLSQIKSSHLY